MLSWEELWHIASQFDSLSDLKANANQLTTLPTMPAAGMQETLTTLHLEYNDIASLSAIASLRQLKALRNLHLKGNNISAIADKPDSSTPVFSSTIHYVDLSYNQIPSWSFIDALPVCFPGLTSLRLSNNPIYDDPDLDGWSAGTSENISSGPSRGVKNNPTEEAHMLAVARLGSLRSLNFSRVGAQDRADAETYYLSRIARQLAAVPLGSPEEAAVKARHPRYDELCQIHGEPDIVRHDGKAEANPAALEARLVDVTFAFDKSEFVGPPITVLGGKGKKRAVMQQKARIPKSFDMYGLRSIAARVVSGATGVPVAPLSLKLVWETGEWDPVAGLRDGEEDEDREDPEEEQRHDEGGHDWMEEDDEEAEAERARMSRWVRREEELKDGPRRLGFSIDGMEARIRVELAGAVR